MAPDHTVEQAATTFQQSAAGAGIMLDPQTIRELAAILVKRQEQAQTQQHT